MNVIARLLRDEKKARTVFKACRHLLKSDAHINIATTSLEDLVHALLDIVQVPVATSPHLVQLYRVPNQSVFEYALQYNMLTSSKYSGHFKSLPSLVLSSFSLVLRRFVGARSDVALEVLATGGVAARVFRLRFVASLCVFT